MTATTNELLDLFLARKALLEGHFTLSSGLHSDRYLQCALLLQDPAVAEDLGRRIASVLNMTANTVLSPAVGGLIIGHEVARAKKTRAIFSEKDENGKPVLRRGFTLEKGEKVIVIEDVITTGLSTNEVISLVETSGGELVGIGSIVNRGGTAAEKFMKWKAPVHSLLNMEVRSWTPGDCALCSRGLPVVKPGSRKI